MKKAVVKLEKNRKKSAKIVAFTALTLILLTGTMFYSTTEARALDWGTIVAIGAGAAAGARLGAFVGDGLGMMVGGALGGVIGYLLHEWGCESSDAAINAKAQSDFAESLRVQQQNLLNVSNSNAENMYTLFNTSEYYFVRKAEVAAKELYDKQILAGEPLIYDGAKALYYANTTVDALAYIWGMAGTYSAVLSSFGTVGNYYYGTYDGMKTYLQAWNSEGAYKVYATTDGSHEFKVLNCLKLENNKYYTFGEYPLYIFSTADGWYYINATDYFNHENAFLYYDGLDELDYDRTYGSVNGNETTSLRVYLHKGEFIKLYAAAPGYHGANGPAYNIVKFELDPALAIFGFGAPIPEDVGYMYPSILAFELDKNTGNITLPYIVYYIPDTSQVYDLRFYYWVENLGFQNADPQVIGITNYWSADGYSGYTFVKITKIFTNEAKVIAQVDDQISASNTYAYTTYQALVNGQMTEAPVYPDIIFPDPQQLEQMNATEAYALWIAFMRHLYFDMQNKTVSDYRNMNISAESFKNLRVIGTIQDQNGTYLAGSNSSYAVFVPYISLQDMNLTIGINNMTQPGFAIVLKDPWYKNTTEGMEMGQITYLPLKTGYTLNVTAIEIDGEQRNYVLLNVTKLEFVVPQLSSPAAPPQLATLGEALMNWFGNHLLTSIFLFAGIGALIFMPAPSNKTWGFILLLGAAAMYFFVEPALADLSGTIGSLLGFNIQINYWRW